MDRKKIFFPSNIKLLRDRKKLSQEGLANALDITRSKVNALESGQTKAPQPEDLLNFSEYFKLSVDTLLKVDLSRLSELSIRELEAGNDIYMRGSNLRIIAITVDGKNRENMEYVPIKAKAGYHSAYNDPEYIASLPKFSLPNLPKSGTFRMFPTTGDSMLPIPEGSDVIAQYVEDWTTIKPATPCILILKGEQDFVFKQVTRQDGGFLLKSYNSLYEPYLVAPEDVLEIWKYYKHQTGSLPEQTDLQEIKRMVHELHQRSIGSPKKD